MVERSNVRRVAANTSARDQQSAPRVGRRERNKQEKRARIVSAARKLFRERGFAETTTQQIAERADIGTGTLFLYAKSKEDILVMVFRDEMIETAKLAFANMPSKGSLVDRLMHVFGLMIRYHERDIELSRILLKEIMFQSAPERREDISELMQVIDFLGSRICWKVAQRRNGCTQNQTPFWRQKCCSQSTIWVFWRGSGKIHPKSDLSSDCASNSRSRSAG